MSHIPGCDAGQLRDRVAGGELSAVEATAACLERVKAAHDPLNAYITVDRTALDQATAVDRRIRQGERPPLAGVPVAVKDNIATAGLETTCASRILRGYVPLEDAAVVQKLRAAGAIVVGKTNLDEFGMGSSTENSCFGSTRNPWDPERVPGGSSGGSAAAVAAGTVPLALGSDTGGSVRQPAAFCGIVGIKPSYGRVSRRGLIAFGSSLEQVGILCRSVRDGALLLELIAGPDPRDATSVDADLSPYREACDATIEGLQVGIPEEYLDAGLDAEFASAIETAAEILTDAGARVRPISLPSTRHAVPAYYLVATAEASSNLARYDGVRYGLRLPQSDGGRPGAESLAELYGTTRAGGFGSEVIRRIMLGTYALSAGYHDEYYGRAQQVRTLVRQDFVDRFAEGIDLMLTPTTPGPAFKLGEKQRNPVSMYLSDIYTVTANLAGLPAISVPLGTTASGLPIGGQLIGPDLGEASLLAAAAAIEATVQMPAPPPSGEASRVSSAVRIAALRLFLALGVVLTCATSLLTALPAGQLEQVVLSSDLKVRVRSGRDVELEVRASSGDDYATIAERVTGSTLATNAVTALNLERPVRSGSWVRVPFAVLSAEYRELALRALFPGDRREGDDWIHVARAGSLPTYDEGLWQVAEWFTGDGANFQALMEANRISSPELRRGQEIRIPAALIHPAFQARLRSDDGALAFSSDAKGPYGTYHLRPGEALYSAVIVRFTGVTASEDVGRVARVLAERSGIRDVTDIPAGYPIKIPMDLLEPEFLPGSHPRRIAAEASQAALAAELERRPVATRTGLDGVLVILDPGHGGRDLGTMNNGIWEHDYVYDVTCRLKQRLEAETSARVVVTLQDLQTGCTPSRADKLKANQQGTIATHPPFLAVAPGEAKIGVNLRWYLANSIYRKALADGYDADRVIFLSIHADSRHASLRGVMVYVPGADYRTRNYGSTSKTYSRYAEVREKPIVSFSKKQRVRSEAISRELAQDLVRAFDEVDLPVQDYQPIRHRIIRGKQRYAPAVIRGNMVPTKVLVEMVNLSNREDAALLASARDRERLADAILRGIYGHFGER